MSDSLGVRTLDGRTAHPRGDADATETHSRTRNIDPRE